MRKESAEMSYLIKNRVILVLLLLMGGSVMRAQALKLDSIQIGNYGKCLYEYDDRSNCTLITDYQCYNNEWQVISIREYTYNDLGLLTSMVTRNDALHKTDYYYNEQSLLAEEIQSYYNGTNWIFDNKKTYDYNEIGKQSLFVEYDYKEGDWIEKEKWNWDYEDGRLLSMTSYVVGVLYEKITYSYNEQGLCDVISMFYRNNEPGQGGWIERFRALYEYDELGNQLVVTVLQTGMDSNELFYKEKKEYLYDNDNNCTHIDYYHSYDYDLGQWSSIVSSFDYTYDPAINVSSIIGFPSVCKEVLEGFDLDVPVSNKLQQIMENSYLGQVRQCTFSYSQWNAINEYSNNHLNVWPNPVSSTVCIDGVDFTKVMVYNALGQLIKETKEDVIDLSAQEAGTYILKVITPSGVVTKKIVKD